MARASSLPLQLVAVEELVLLTAGAVGTLQAADEKNGNAHRDQNGKDARIDLKPVHETIHTHYLTWFNTPKWVLNRTSQQTQPDTY